MNDHKDHGPWAWEAIHLPEGSTLPLSGLAYEVNADPVATVRGRLIGDTVFIDWPKE